MTASVVATTIGVPSTAGGRAVARLNVRLLHRGALIVAVVCAGMSATVAIQYRTTFENSIDLSGLRALVENPAIRILFGPPVALDNAGGFTVWRTGTPLLLIASVWALLATTRITRGEEESGRADLLLAGRLSRAGLVLRSMAAMAGAAVVIGAATGAALAAAGTDAIGALLYAASLFGVTLTFAFGAALAAQLMPTRSAALGLTVGVLGLALLFRMLSDGAPGLAWMAWTTPFGLAARAAPYADDRAAPLVVLAGFPLAFGLAALLAARHRDLGRGLVRVAVRRAPRTTLLGSVGGFAVRRAIRPTAAWAVGIAVYFLLIGALIASVLQFFDANRRFADLAAAAGFAGLDSANGFAAALFGLLAIPTSLYGATRLAAFVADERERRWTPVFATQISRIRLAGTEIAITTVGMVILHTIAALAIWTGAAITGAPLTLGDALAGALNSAPIAWLAVGAASVAVGWLPTSVGAVGAIPVAGGFLLKVIADSTGGPKWIADLSPFAHLAAVPGTTPNWIATFGFIVISAALIGLGLMGYHQRDLTT